MGAEMVDLKNIEAAVRSLWPKASDDWVELMVDDYRAVRNRLWAMVGSSAPFDRKDA